MIFAKSIEDFYIKHKEEIERLRFKHNLKPVQCANLEDTNYIDDLNRRYYRFPKAMGLPIDRLGQLKMFTQYLSKGLSAEEDEAIDAAIRKALDDGLQSPKSAAAARIGALLMEREKRKQFTFHTTLFYNILAVQWIREDENPLEFDQAIHFEKVQHFMKAESKEAILFFFHQPELSGLTSLLKILEKDVLTYFQESKAMIQELSEKLSLINSFTSTSKSAEKSGAKN
jgi:hypothetical protein